MKYLLFFESHAKAQSLLNKYADQLSVENLEFADYIKQNVAPGYVGKLTEMYLYFTLEKVDITADLKYIIANIKDVKVKPIDTYGQRDVRILVKDIKLAKIVQALNKIKKNNSIKYAADINQIAKYVYDNNLDLTTLVKLPIHNQIHSDADFIAMLAGSLFQNIKYHPDWDILYETDHLLIYEILSYEGGKHLIHVNQCTNNEAFYKNYKKLGYRFYNLIDKNNLSDSLFIDGHPTDGVMEYDIFKWDDFLIGRIVSGSIQINDRFKNSEVLKKVNLFIDHVINLPSA